MSTLLLRLMVGASGAALAVVCAGSVMAQEQAAPEPPAPSAAPSATPGPTPEAAGAPAPASTPVPAEAAVVADERPGPTPWAWPFPWMEQATAAQALTADQPAVQASPSEAGKASRIERSRARRALFSATADPPAAEAQAPLATDGNGLSTPAPPGPSYPTPAAPQPATQIGPAGGSAAACTLEAYEHSISSDTAAIYQVAVRYEDCSWGGSQVLLSFDIRGPPSIDVLTQSSDVAIDVEVFVTRHKVRLGLAYAGRDGALTPAAPLALDPTLTATQQGNNVVEFVQDGFSSSGDALSGSQNVGLTVEGDASSIRILAQNACDGCLAMSGDASSVNDVIGQAGPDASATGIPASSSQIGDNDVSLEQDAVARSGHALAGSQKVSVTVTGSLGTLAIMAGNATVDASAISGNATAVNDAVGLAGPGASSTTGPAQSSQVGDNTVQLDQRAVAATGDALAGAQLIDVLVGGRVDVLTVTAVNGAQGAFAQSGDALASNLGTALAGPRASAGLGAATASQIGDDNVWVSQAASASTGLAAAGSQVIRIQVGQAIGDGTIQHVNDATGAAAVSGTADAVNDADGAVGPVAEGTAASTTQQTGDTTLSLDQAADAVSGDAVSGAVVVGVVESGGQAVAATAAAVVADTASSLLEETGAVLTESIGTPKLV